jgi:hypothetical protein
MDTEFLVRNIVRSQIAHRPGNERLSHAGAVPTTALALVTELFRDWASPLAGPARDVIYWYLTEVLKLSGEVGVAAGEKLFVRGTQRLEFGTVTVEGDRAVLEWRVRGRSAATGLDYDKLYCAVFVLPGPRSSRVPRLTPRADRSVRTAGCRVVSTARNDRCHVRAVYSVKAPSPIAERSK